MSKSRKPPRKTPQLIMIAILVTGLTTLSPVAKATATETTAGTSTTETSTTETRNDGRWLDRDGEPLPFASDEEVLDFLRHAAVVESKVLGGSINRPQRLVLERGGVRARAIFRTVDRTHYRPGERRLPDFRDRHVYEVAAYELGRLLGIDQIPPATLRTIDGEEGSIQLWVENARSEAERMGERQPIANGARWHKQRQVMLLFDSLIFNHDRNHGNLLTDVRGRLWLVDHTRSFMTRPSLPSAARQITICERSLWQRLQALEPATVHASLAPYLSKTEIDAVLKRRVRLLRQLERMIADRGAEAVLYDLV